jgi:hypothetical protein
MEYFLHKNLGKIKNLWENKTKQISKRGKNKIWERFRKRFFGFNFEKIFLLLFLSNY